MPNFQFGMGLQSNPMDAYNEMSGMVKQSRLAKLMGEAYEAPQPQRSSLLSQIAGIDPQSAHDVDQRFSRMDQQQAQRLQEHARLASAAWKSGNKQMAQGIYAQMLPIAKSVYPGFEASEMLDDSIVGMFDQMGGPEGDNTPSDIRSLQMLQASPELLKLDRERRQAAGMVPKLVQTAQGYGWGTPGGAIESAPMGSTAAPTQGDMEADIALANQMAQAGIDPEKIDAFIAARGQRAESPQAIAQPRDQIITPYQQAQLEMQQQAQQRAGNAEARAQAEFERKAANPINAQAQREQSAIRSKVPQLQNAIRGLGRIENAINKLDGKMVNTGPMDALVQKYTPQGQELDAAVGAIQNSVLALTRVPGIGSQSDLEARIAALQYPSLDKPPEVNRRTLANLKLFMRDLAEAYKLAVQSSTVEPPANGGFRILPD